MLRFLINLMSAFLAGCLATLIWWLCFMFAFAASTMLEYVIFCVIPAFLIAFTIGRLLVKVNGARLWLLPSIIGWICGTLANPAAMSLVNSLSLRQYTLGDITVQLALCIGYIATGIITIWLSRRRMWLQASLKS